MRFTSILTAATCALLFLFAGAAGANHSNGIGPPKDLVAGTARLFGFNDP
jgi:hypothetical protein